MYPIDISSKFIYAESNTLIQYELDKISNKSSEDVVVFLDIVPDNPKTISLYKQLVKNVGKFKTFIIMPIPCREYYYIK